MSKHSTPFGPERILHVHRAKHLEDDEASDFAAEIMMPEQKFRELRDLYQGDVHLLAEAFGVPVLAVHRRAAMLGMKGHFIKDLDRWDGNKET
jgi:Zn-dependent peptidase ImmA (M78 family)